jgi:phage-related protein
MSRQPDNDSGENAQPDVSTSVETHEVRKEITDTAADIETEILPDLQPPNHEITESNLEQVIVVTEPIQEASNLEPILPTLDNDEIIVVTVIQDQNQIAAGKDTEYEKDLLPKSNPNDLSHKPDGISELPVYNITDTEPIPKPEMTDGLPTFEENMNPKTQSKTVKTLAIICLPFYILFYELPIAIYDGAMWIGRVLKAAGIATLEFIKQTLILIGKGIYLVFDFIFNTFIYKPICFILRVVYKYILIPIKNLIMAILNGIRQLLFLIWRSIFIPIYEFISWIGKKAAVGVVIAAKYIYDFILTPIWNGIAWVCRGIYDYILVPIWRGIVCVCSTVYFVIAFIITSIYRGIAFIITSIYRGIAFIVTSIYRGICAVCLFTYQYFLLPIASFLYQVFSAIYSGIAYVCYNIYLGVSFVFLNIYRGMAFIATNIMNGIIFVLGYLYLVLQFLGYCLGLVVNGIFKGIGYFLYGIMVGIQYTFTFIANCISAIGMFLQTYVLVPIWNGLKYLGNGIYILISNVFNTCAYIFKHYIVLPIYNWILCPIWNYIMVPTYRGFVYIARGIANLAKTVASFISSIITSIFNSIKSVYVAIREVFRSIYLSLKAAFSAMYASMNAARINMMAGIKETLNGIRSSFRA